MARFILKWRYIKKNAPKHLSHLVKYIAMREGVEKESDWKTKPATSLQKKLVDELVRDFPDVISSDEYKEYSKTQTKESASNLIDYAIDTNVDLIGRRENYVGYIAKRPNVEKQGSHGLFSQDDKPIDLDAVADEVANHEGVVWTTVMSLKSEDAKKFGYDNAESWKILLRSQANILASSMGIPLKDLKWYAAFHNAEGHPHVHLISYSKGKKPYMTRQGLEKLKASFAHEIFKQKLVNIYSEQTERRNELKKSSKEIISDIVEQINNGEYRNETVELMLKKLAEQLENYSGKKVYGYLPKTAKNLINGIVDELQKDKRIQKLYDLWYEQRENVLKTYRDDMPERIKLSENKEFKSIKNMIIKEVDRLLNWEDAEVYEADAELSDETRIYNNEENQTDSDDTAPSETDKDQNLRTKQEQKPVQTPVGLVTLKLFVGLARLIYNDLEHDDAGHAFADKKLMQKTAQKKIAHGQKLG